MMTGLAVREGNVAAYKFTDLHFDKLRMLVAETTGISLSDHKRDLLYGRLTRRLRALGLQDFDQYIALLADRPDDELQNFINAVTTNLTSFFRENHHFEFLANELFPQLEKQGRARGMRIWSAGCSTGEEAYSIAMTVREYFADAGAMDIKILASDLDTSVVQTAANGIYDQSRIEGMPPERVKRWFQRGSGSNAGKVRVRRELAELITFRQLNLMQAWPMQSMFDVVFCRNVVIYFDKPTQSRLFNNFASVIKPGGHLIIGHSETLHKVCDRFELIGKTIYRKPD
ncbi:protein-glutamate O-methyltransferase CheR [Granulosicoccaceae sp. 1_MG-2023]|nr:protein-glutamate O-methyltransferase CheR [Granulosicoccaceae sp. 1_MG-2023]